MCTNDFYVTVFSLRAFSLRALYSNVNCFVSLKETGALVPSLKFLSKSKIKKEIN
jgi:hypothetical protein